MLVLAYLNTHLALVFGTKSLFLCRFMSDKCRMNVGLMSDGEEAILPQSIDIRIVNKRIMSDVGRN